MIIERIDRIDSIDAYSEPAARKGNPDPCPGITHSKDAGN